MLQHDLKPAVRPSRHADLEHKLNAFVQSVCKLLRLDRHAGESTVSAQLCFSLVVG